MPATTQRSPEPDLSIVTSLYNSAAFLQEFHARISHQAAQLTQQFELVLVNDGSPDDSLDRAMDLCRRDERVRVVDLSRNFGQHKAVMTGLAYTRGKLVFQLDCDLEEDPELLGVFFEKMKETNADVVYGVQAKRQGSLLKRLSGHLFYRVFEMLSTHPVPANPLNARLMTRRYVESLLMHREHELYLAGLWAIAGYVQVPVEVNKHSRGASNYTLRKKIAMTITALVSFSNRPLDLVFYLGIFITSCSLLAATAMVALRVLSDTYHLGWASLIVSIWLLGGLTIFCLGIMSMYLSRIFVETKNRPYTIVRGVFPAPQEETAASDSLRRIEGPHATTKSLLTTTLRSGPKP